MTDQSETDGDARSPDETHDNTPVVTCSRCGREWSLEYELEDLHAGNQAYEQFALDHQRHTGHYPDDVTPWVATCQQCPAREQYLSERPTRRWAKTHARHTRHDVVLEHGEETAETIQSAAESVQDRDGE